MVVRHPLFGRDDPLSDHWDALGLSTTSQDDRLQALLSLSAHPKKLPGLAFFVVPPGAEDDEDWQYVIRDSRPYCNCKSRRVLVPARGRSRFIPATVPRMVTLSNPAKVESGAGVKLALAPHGGDLASAYSLWKLYYESVVAVHAGKPRRRTAGLEPGRGAS